MALKVAALVVSAVGLDVSLDQYGAVEGPDGREATSEGFRRALANIDEAGGGSLTIPLGSWYVSPVALTSNLVLWLSAGATLVAETGPLSKLPVIPALPSWGPVMSEELLQKEGFLRSQADLRDAIARYQPLLWGNKVRNVTITGENGTIDGRGADWWTRWLKEPLLGRPHVIQFQDSEEILIRNVTIRNPGFWTVHLWRCEYVTIQYLTILVEPWMPAVRPTNTDGVNPDSSRHILIEDSYLQTGDDAIAVKSGWDCFGRQNAVASENITIRRVTVRQTRGCNAAAFTIGSEMSGGVQDVLIEECSVLNAGVAVEIKVGSSRGGFVRGIEVRKLEVMATARGALVVMASYPEANPFCRGQTQPAPSVSNISFQDVNVHGPTQGSLVQFVGTPEVFMKNLTVYRLWAKNGAWNCNDRISGHAEECRPQACWKLRPRSSGPTGGASNSGSATPIRPTRWTANIIPRQQAVPATLQDGQTWRNDGRCGASFPTSNGLPSRCPTATEFQAEEKTQERQSAEPFLRNAPCCSLTGWCGVGIQHCECSGCIDYRKVMRQKRVHQSRANAKFSKVLPSRSISAQAKVQSSLSDEEHAKMNGFQSSFAVTCSLTCFICILLVRRYVPGASKHWLCRTPHVCVGTLVLVTFLQCGLSVWHYSQPVPATFQEDTREHSVPMEIVTSPSPSSLETSEAPVTLIDAETAETAEEAVGTSPDITELPCGEVLTPMDFGAKGDGRQDDSKPVWAAIAHGIRCNTTVLLGPPRRMFLVMPNALEVTAENVVIIFEAQLVGPSLEAWNPTMDVWPKGSCAYAEANCQRGGGQSPEFARSQWSLLFFRNCRNVTLLGRSSSVPQGQLRFQGGLHAPGNSFWRVRNMKPQVRGYCLLKMDMCEVMRISYLHLHDSPMYQIVVARSRGVELFGLRITLSNQALGDNGAHNTDGVNILNSSQVTLRRSVIESGDDNVVVKEGSSEIFAEELQLRRGKGVSIGSLGEREAEGQEVTNVAFRDVSADRSVHGVRIKTWKGAHGLVQNASFERFRTSDVMIGILIDQTYCPPSQRPEGCNKEDENAAIRINQVHFRDFSGTFQQIDRKVLCSACDDVTYENIALRPAGPALPPNLVGQRPPPQVRRFASR